MKTVIYLQSIVLSIKAPRLPENFCGDNGSRHLAEKIERIAVRLLANWFQHPLAMVLAMSFAPCLNQHSEGLFLRGSGTNPGESHGRQVLSGPAVPDLRSTVRNWPGNCAALLRFAR